MGNRQGDTRRLREDERQEQKDDEEEQEGTDESGLYTLIIVDEYL